VAKPKKKPQSSLNPYQKFLKTETKKEKYRNMRGSERMCAIALAWDIRKKELEKAKKRRGRRGRE